MADEKYRLTLEGSDIDEALLRLANYEDEGLVLGSRKGVMLGPGSEYYHKNARYYAELAQSAVPGDTTSAVRWDIDQSALTEADRELARKNIMAGGSNRNLLDNPWFTVNQRGTTQTSSGNSYIADRWVVSGNTYTWTYARAALSVTNASGSIAYLFQKLPSEVYADINGKTVTYSVMINGTVYSVPFTWDTTKRNAAITIDGLTGIMFWYGDQNQPCLRITVGGTWTVNAIKLELGSVSTLANDAPPDYGEELFKCMRYFQRMKASAGTAYIGTGVCFTSQAYCVVNLPIPLRATSVTTAINGALSVQIPGSVLTASGQTIYVRTPSTIMIAATISGATAGQACLLALKDSGNYIDISADL